MTEEHKPRHENGFLSRLGRTRAVTAKMMSVERGWPLVLPLIIVVSLFLSLSWLGVFRIVPDAGRIALLALFAISAIAALVPLFSYRHPSSDEVDRRIENANALEHTPLLVQSDQPSQPQDPFALALWREHQRRMSGRLAGVTADLPRTRVPERDPFALRAVPVLLLAVAFAFSFGTRGGSITDAFHARPGAEAPPPRVDAWVTPPTYTGKPPLFLTAEGNAALDSFTVPAGSDVTLRVSGGAGNETVRFTDSAGVVTEMAAVDPNAAPAPGGAAPVAAQAAPPTAGGPAAAAQFSGKLEADGAIALMAGDAAMKTWRFSVTPDTPPVIRFKGEPKSAANGALELQYEIIDDYGAKTAKAEFVLDVAQANDAKPLYEAPEMPLSLPRRGGKDPAAKTNRDLTEHVWSGAPVRLTLVATDDAGNEARSEVKTFVMPAKPFSNPLARAMVDLRQIFSLDANRKPYVLDLIDAITLRPEDTIPNLSHYLGIMAGRTQLKIAGNDDALRATADYFWQMALQIEEGDLSDAEKRLRQAQQALKDALRNGASDEEISKRMQELREAMNEYLREFAEKAARDQNSAQQNQQQGQELRQSDLDRMMDQIENLAKSGNRSEAEQLLSELENMMNNLQAGRQQQNGQNGQQQSEMRRQMDKLGEIMKRQQETMNETFRMDRMQRGQQGEGENGEQQQGQGQQPGEGQQPGQGMTPEEFADAMKQLQEGQGQLQQDLEAFQKGLEGMGIQPGQGFGEAGEAMGEAEGSLGQGEGDRAVGQQGRALEALRRGAQDMMQQMQQAMQGDEGGSEQGGRQQNADRDPLGRPRATSGPDFGDSVKVPDEIDVQRARQILEAIRKRLGNALSPDIERNYLERLLELR